MSTSLMPLDPAMSPQQVARLLPIRAKLLPSEITSRRNARRMRAFVIAAVLVAIAGLGGWSADAYHDHSLAKDDLAAVNAQIDKVNNTMTDPQHAAVTKAVSDNKAMSDELKTLMANDLRWSTLLDNVRSTGTKAEITISQITVSLADKGTTTTGPATAGAAPVATLSLQGTAKDKSTIAGFIKKLGSTPGIGNPYLTTASQSAETADTAAHYTFTISADVTSSALCGRFTTPCKTGGK
ncbi:PilN domain-containing protein [Actinoplanes sp. NPDC051343]|uniref:PilN domain-containing protein n=1 Tax=Actinoplanes sp. NPDC051343 TaxID=3363906 RepID=UPI0037969AC2